MMGEEPVNVHEAHNGLCGSHKSLRESRNRRVSRTQLQPPSRREFAEKGIAGELAQARVCREMLTGEPCGGEPCRL